MNASGDNIALTPPTNARSHSPNRKLRTAKCAATNDDEHAVSTAKLGPCNPNKHDNRPAAMLKALPVPL
jgi:hypothetical protein